MATMTMALRGRRERPVARNSAVAAQGPAAQGQAEGVLGATLGKLFALAENYPDLKANTTMNNLMEELTSTENKVSFARQAYNDAVMTYNTACESVPTNFIASMFSFKHAEFLEMEEAEKREAPKVSFN